MDDTKTLQGQDSGVISPIRTDGGELLALQAILVYLRAETRDIGQLIQRLDAILIRAKQ